MTKLERVKSGLVAEMPHRVIDCRIVEVLEALDKRLTYLNDRDYDKHIRLNDAFKRLTALEKQAKPFDGWFENLDERITALEEIAHEHIGYSDPPVKPAPLSCCEGCAGFPCSYPRPGCYREKTCVDCKHDHALFCGGFSEHSCWRWNEGRSETYHSEKVEACPNFEATQ